MDEQLKTDLHNLNNKELELELQKVLPLFRYPVGSVSMMEELISPGPDVQSLKKHNAASFNMTVILFAAYTFCQQFSQATHLAQLLILIGLRYILCKNFTVSQYEQYECNKTGV